MSWIFFALIIGLILPVSACPTACKCFTSVLSEVHVQCIGIGITSVKTLNFPARTVTLNLKNNPLRHLRPQDFHGLTNLRKLILIDTHLIEIGNNTFDGLRNLESLILTYNQLKRFEKNQFQPLCKLKALIANHNHLRTVHPAAFNGLTLLEDLDLSINRLSILHENTLASLTSLRRLSLDRSLDHIFTKMHSLT